MKNRDFFIDFIRTIAIISMVFTHVFEIFQPNQNIFNRGFFEFGTAFCFPAFLFCYGASYYLTREKRDVSIRTVSRRLAVFFLTYFILCLTFWFFVEQTFHEERLLNFMFGNIIPYFGEFIITFMFLEIILFFFYARIKMFSRNIYLLLSFAIVLFLLTQILPIPVFTQGNYFLLIVFGSDKTLHFPIIFYLLTTMIGINFVENKVLENKKDFTVITTVLLIINILFIHIFHLAEMKFFNLVYIFIFGIIFIYFKDYFALIKKYIENLSKLALLIFALHPLVIHLIFLAVEKLWGKEVLKNELTPFFVAIAALLILYYSGPYLLKLLKKDFSINFSFQK